jgi:acyl-CoA reductase-like NAD-dependent aldehyde dehydrogenase
LEFNVMATSTMPTYEHELGDIRVFNPRTGAPLYTLTEPDESEIPGIFQRGWDAFESMKRLTVRERLSHIGRIREYIRTNKEAIIDRIVTETGKPRTEALLTEVFPTLDLIDYYEKNAKKILRDQKAPTPALLMGKKSKIYYEPLGTVLVISPWNYPFNLSMTPIITALIAGNSVIFKPSEYTPLKGLIEEIFAGSGLPQHAVQVVYGGKETGRLLVDGKSAKIFFTGSERAGKSIMAHAANNLIPVELELGGKDPMLVFDDVNLERTVNGALWGSMTNSGQTCTSVERIYVQEKIYPQFVAMMREKLQKLATPVNPRQGNHVTTDVGCMTTDFQIHKVEAQIRDAVSKGATVECGGKRVDESHSFPPTLISGVTPEMHIYAEESFGPVATIVPFRDESEAIRMANDSPYGLSASVWSADLDRADRVTRAIVTGNVSINNVLATQGNSALPFGGTKMSGFGRYKGPHGLYSFSNVKSVMVDKQSAKIEAIWYPYSDTKYHLLSRMIDLLFTGRKLDFVRALLTGLKWEKEAQKNRL